MIGRVTDPSNPAALYRRQQELDSERKIAAILLETGNSVDDLDAERGHLKDATPLPGRGFSFMAPR